MTAWWQTGGQSVCGFWVVNFSNAAMFVSLRNTSLLYQGSQGCCGVMRKLEQEQGVMFSLLVLV